MGLIIEVDNYIGLETLEIDILEATKGKTEYVLNKEKPVKAVESDLKAFASYEGLRHESEIMSNQWRMGDVYVVFTKKKISKSIDITSSENGSI